MVTVTLLFDIVEFCKKVGLALSLSTSAQTSNTARPYNISTHDERRFDGDCQVKIDETIEVAAFVFFQVITGVVPDAADLADRSIV
jgi:hypothetical protein